MTEWQNFMLIFVFAITVGEVVSTVIGFIIVFWAMAS